MRKRQLLLLLPISAIAVVGIIMSVPSSQPVWEGRTLEQWLITWRDSTLTPNDRGDFAGPLARKEDAERAVKRIGTNAIPHLLKWISYEPSPWLRNPGQIQTTVFRAFPKLNDWLSQQTSQKQQKASLATEGFFLLRTSATSAAPQLEDLATDRKRQFSARCAAIALGFLGEAADPYLVRVVTRRPELAPFRLTTTNIPPSTKRTGKN